MTKKKLIITESPTKARALSNSIGSNKEFIFVSCYGRILELDPITPDAFLSDQEIKWTPINAKNLAYIEKVAKDADLIFIATDPDIEGEVIAWQLDQLFQHISIDQSKILRINIDSFTQEGIEKSIRESTSIESEKAQSGISRRIFDNFAQFNLPDSAIKSRPFIKGSSSRIAAPTLKSIADKPLDSHSIKYQRKGMPIPAHLKINADQDYEKITRLLDRLPPPVFQRIKKETKKRKAEGLDFQRLLLKSKELTNSPQSEIYDSLQNLYVKGKISYFRTDSRVISPEQQKHLQRVIKAEGADNIKFPDRGEVDPRKIQDGHWAIAPLSSIGNALSEFSKMDLESQILSVVWRHWILNTQDRMIISEEGVLEPNAFENKIWKELEKDFDLSFIQQKITTKYGKEASFDETFKPLGVNRHPHEKNERYVSIRHSKEESLIRRMIDLGIGRPSTLIYHSNKIGSAFINDKNKLNSRGISAVIENAKAGNRLLDIENAKKIEENLLSRHSEVESENVLKEALKSSGHAIEDVDRPKQKPKPKRHSISWGDIGI